MYNLENTLLLKKFESKSKMYKKILFYYEKVLKFNEFKSHSKI
jgi:hypothetical protein